MDILRIAQAQINVTVGDLVANTDKIIRWIERAREASADVVTFPELALCGYPPEDLLLKPKFIRDNWTMLEHLAKQCKGITAVVGFADSEGDKVYNSAALIHEGRLVGVYHKIELPNYGVFDEKRYFEAGSGCLVFEMHGMRFSLTVCEDVWIPGSMAEKFAVDNGTDVVLNISASPFHAGKLTVRHQVVKLFARATGTTVFLNNLVGGQDELMFDGGSLVMNPTGEVIASAKRFEEHLLITDLDVDPSASTRTDRPGRVFHLEPAGSESRGWIQPTLAPDLSRLDEVYKALVLGTQDYVLKNGFKKVVIGLSGGIDSSLTVAVAVEALGTENVIGVTMPSEYTSEGTLSDAGALADKLNIQLITVPIGKIFHSFLDELKDPFGDGPLGIEAENLQARIRANILMSLSNRFGWLVLTTGNKSETAVGYCTLYGDMAGGFAVIKDVPKTTVFELSEYVNQRAEKELIPRSVIERPPTAELAPDQKDEDSLPPYDILDPILQAYVEQDRTRDEISALGFAAETVDEVIRMVDRNEYKRRQGTPGIKITPRAFGKDRRMPITNLYS
jgi:NAD+ synthase (glutamine-hydrolysing)